VSPRSDDAVRHFFAEIRRRPLLTHEGERALAIRIVAGRLAIFEALACFPPVYDIVAGWRQALEGGASPWLLRVIGVDNSAEEVFAGEGEEEE
jgi:hypothetical protein